MKELGLWEAKDASQWPACPKPPHQVYTVACPVPGVGASVMIASLPPASGQLIMSTPSIPPLHQPQAELQQGRGEQVAPPSYRD